MEGGGVGWWGRVTGVWVDRGAVWRNGGVWHQARINDRTKGLLPASGGRRERERGPRGGVAPLMHSKSTHCLQGDAASVNHTVQKGETDMWRHTVWHHRPQNTVSSRWTGGFQLTPPPRSQHTDWLKRSTAGVCQPHVYIFTHIHAHTHTQACEGSVNPFYPLLMHMSLYIPKEKSKHKKNTVQIHLSYEDESCFFPPRSVSCCPIK